MGVMKCTLRQLRWLTCCKNNNTISVAPFTTVIQQQKNSGQNDRVVKTPGHLYLIKEREFIKTNEHILKIGKSTRIKSRMPSYPKDSRIYLIVYCPWDIHVAEKELIKQFDSIFINRKDIGREYYEASSDDYSTMLHEFMNIGFAHF